MRKTGLLIAGLFVLCLFLLRCESSEMRITTGEVSDILSSSVKITGYIISAGEGIKRYGHCYSTKPGPLITDQKTESVSVIGEGMFSSFIQGLEPGTKYYVRAYITMGSKTEYGDEVSFTTAGDAPPLVETLEITDITSLSAVGGGYIIYDGGIPVTARGVCWSESALPTVEDNKTTDGSGSGNFTSILNDLTANTTYYVRAYATRVNGSVYGNEIMFTTSE